MWLYDMVGEINGQQLVTRQVLWESIDAMVICWVLKCQETTNSFSLDLNIMGMFCLKFALLMCHWPKEALSLPFHQIDLQTTRLSYLNRKLCFRNILGSDFCTHFYQPHLFIFIFLVWSYQNTLSLFNIVLLLLSKWNDFCKKFKDILVISHT